MNNITNNKNIVYKDSNNIKNNLILNLNKKILNYPHNKITPYLEKFYIIDYKFNTAVASYKAIQNKGINVINNINYYKSINYIINILNTFFNTLNCIINKPKFINTPNKLIIRLNYYQSNTNNDPLSLNKTSNLAYKTIATSCEAKQLISGPNNRLSKETIINKKV
jgi:hypothetical protein